MENEIEGDGLVTIGPDEYLSVFDMLYPKLGDHIYQVNGSLSCYILIAISTGVSGTEDKITELLLQYFL